jgi:general secretion pathway protein N
LLWPLLLLAACAAAGARLYDEWQQAPDAPAGASSAAADGSGAAAATGTDAALALPPPTEFAVIADRPLFAQSRRPPPPAQAAEPAPPPAEAAPAPAPEVVEAPPPEPPPTIDFTLLGIVTADGDRHAVVRQSDGAVVEIPEGGDISGWFAVLIDPERAVFRQGSTEEELVLHFDAPVPPELIPPPRPAKAPPAPPPSPDAQPPDPQPPAQ